MIKKKYFIIILVSLAVLAGGFFGYKYFSGSSATKIEIQSEVVESDNQGDKAPADSNDDSKGSTLETASDMPRSNLSAANDPKGSTSELSEDTPRLNLGNDVGIINKLVSWGYEKASGRKIDTVIIHSTYNALGGDQFSLDKILDIYKSYGVAPHYIIDRSGKIYRLVADENIAYHAGESQVPDGRTSVNNFSIGIEMINSKTDKFTANQYDSLNYLLRYLSSKYKIKYILGHNQIAPGRKDDPWNIVWDKVVK